MTGFNLRQAVGEVGWSWKQSEIRFWMAGFPSIRPLIDIPRPLMYTGFTLITIQESE